MLYLLGDALTGVWGPFRLLRAYPMLLGLGAALGAAATLYLLPRLWRLLPQDRGRAFTPGTAAAVAKGKPTGAGLLLVLLLLPVLLLVLPCNARLFSVIGCLLLAMLTGYLDDRSTRPWSDYLKGTLDIGVALLAALAFCQGRPVAMWLPLLKVDPVSHVTSFAGIPLQSIPWVTVDPERLAILVPVWLFLPLATLLLWMTINATNCTDGIDGLAGTLTLLSLFYLAGFLYLVIGHRDNAAYLLVPHNPEGARWAVLLLSAGGALAGYLWHNAEPSRVMMGDAGSRFLGLLLGLAALAAGNPFLVVVVAPVILVNGGSGIVKIALLRLMRRLGLDTRTPVQRQEQQARANGQAGDLEDQHLVVVLLHRVRFPLHDHCRKNLGWSNAQVLLRFLLIQMFATPLLLGLLVKIR